ncbi:WD40-repeat-containing domain superfamily [Sesbania bispinosa]|nr:WD40-repeat-containing domain superfamily [Sesbania bispinosa]
MKEENINSNGFVSTSFNFISSCIKTATSGDRKDQVLWTCFDRLEFGPSSFKHVLLLGYSNGFQVLDVEDASNVRELVSKHDDPVSFLQMQPIPERSEGHQGFRASHPILLLVTCDKSKIPGTMQNGRDGLLKDHTGAQAENIASSATTVRFYSLRSHTYVHALRFRSSVYMVRCSSRIVVVGLATQVLAITFDMCENCKVAGRIVMVSHIYCFDALTLENRFSVLTHPVPQLGGQGMVGVNIGYGPMAVGPRWLAYASNNPLMSNTGHLSPKSLTPPAVSRSTSPQSQNKHLVAGLINLSGMGYKTLSKYCQDIIPDGSNSPVSSNSSWKVSQFASHPTETDTAGVVIVKDFVSRAVVAQLRAHNSPISALCFDPSGTLLVTASIHGNNINIFQIIPSSSGNGSGCQSGNWGYSHVHLYKLHCGMTSVVIQDICFSHSSQWIAIISSKVNQQQFCLEPPPPIVLSVVSRIKNNNAGWLNTVSNAASSAAGKVSIPSGLVLVLLLLPPLRAEPSGTVPRLDPVPAAQIQEENLGVKVEPIQWWDVRRRHDWPEREVHILGNTLEASEVILETLDYQDNSVVNINSVKLHEQCHFSSAEIQISSGKISIWQKSEVSFFVMSPLEAKDMNLCEFNTSREIEIENIPIKEIEIRQKDLLPIFNHFHGIQSSWVDGGIVIGICSSSSSDSHGAGEKLSEDTVISHSKLMIPGPALKADVDMSAYFSSSIDLSGNEINGKNRNEVVLEPPLSNLKTVNMEGYCKVPVNCNESAEVVTEVDCSSPCGREISEVDDDNDDLLGSVFDFSEEGAIENNFTFLSSPCPCPFCSCFTYNYKVSVLQVED